jgi:hypothetical protein
MKTRRTLIRSPREWQMASAAVRHPAIPVLAERGGTQLKTLRAVILVDTREQNPFDIPRLMDGFQGSRRDRSSWVITQWRGWKVSAWWKKTCPI